MPLFLNITQKQLKALDGCLNVKNPDDCASVCRTHFGFSTMVNYENENKPKLAAFNDAIVNYTKTFVFPKDTVNATPAFANTSQIRRVRRLLPMNAVDELNMYRVQIKKYGLDLDQYTRQNLDGYDEITMTEVFSGKILAGALAGLLLGLFL